MEHTLKIKYEYAIEVYLGNKTYEVRKNDRNFKKGDTVVFEVVDPLGKKTDLTFAMPKYEITHVFYGGKYGLDEGYCVFAIKPIKKTFIDE